MREGCGNVVAAVFCIRHVDVDDPVKETECLHSIVSPGIVDNRDRQSPSGSDADALYQLRDDVGWRHDVDVVASPLLQADHHVRKLFRGDFTSPPAPG